MACVDERAVVNEQLTVLYLLEREEVCKEMIDVLEHVRGVRVACHDLRLVGLALYGFVRVHKSTQDRIRSRSKLAHTTATMMMGHIGSIRPRSSKFYCNFSIFRTAV